jgi:hypothetical protein
MGGDIGSSLLQRTSLSMHRRRMAARLVHPGNWQSFRDNVAPTSVRRIGGIPVVAPVAISTLLLTRHVGATTEAPAGVLGARALRWDHRWARGSVIDAAIRDGAGPVEVPIAARSMLDPG